MHRNHPPRFGHDATELTLNTESLAKQSNISSEQREDRRPISNERIHPAAVRKAYKNDDVRNAIGQIIQNFPPPGCLSRGYRHHAVEHVQPQSQITKQWPDDEKQRISL